MSKRNDDAPTGSTRKVQTINPATEEVLKEYEIVNEEQINESVKEQEMRLQNGKKTLTRERIICIHLPMN
jgi:hypothetical protein